jgi:hypothetical protein
MYTKAQQTKLIKICKVLFPEYKSVKFCKYRHVGSIIFYDRTSTQFKRRWRLSLTELLQFQLPQKLALFKYGNVTFMNVIIEDLIRCDINKHSRLTYFYDELVKIKFSDVYKQLNVEHKDIPGNVVETDVQCQLLDDMVITYSSKSEEPIRMKVTNYAQYIGRDVLACFCLTVAFVLFLILK